MNVTKSVRCITVFVLAVVSVVAGNHVGTCEDEVSLVQTRAVLSSRDEEEVFDLRQVLNMYERSGTMQKADEPEGVKGQGCEEAHDNLPFELAEPVLVYNGDKGLQGEDVIKILIEQTLHNAKLYDNTQKRQRKSIRNHSSDHPEYVWKERSEDLVYRDVKCNILDMSESFKLTEGMLPISVAYDPSICNGNVRKKHDAFKRLDAKGSYVMWNHGAVKCLGLGMALDPELCEDDERTPGKAKHLKWTGYTNNEQNEKVIMQAMGDWVVSDSDQHTLSGFDENTNMWYYLFKPSSHTTRGTILISQEMKLVAQSIRGQEESLNSKTQESARNGEWLTDEETTKRDPTEFIPSVGLLQEVGVA